jgi:hypothetical protein
MAITLMTTTGTQDGVNAALGLPPADPATASDSSATPARATADAVPTKPTVSAPVEPTAAAEAPIEEPLEEPELPADASPQQQGAHTRNRLQKRINDLVKERYSEKGRADALETELARVRQQLAQAPPATPMEPVTTAAPVLPGQSYKEMVERYKSDPLFPKDDDFENYEDVQAARAVFVSDKRAEERDAEASAKAREAAAQKQRDDLAAAEQVAQKALLGKIQAFATAHPDYETVVGNPALSINGAMRLVITNPNNPGPELAYYLGQHPEECARIAALPPAESFEAMGELKAKLAPVNGRSTSAPTVPVTRVPPPPTEIRGGAVATTEGLEVLAKKITPGSALTSEWIARRNAEEAKRRR